jgi:hypothetical protein
MDGFLLPTLGVPIGLRGISPRFRLLFDKFYRAFRFEWDPLVGIPLAEGSWVRMGFHPVVSGLGILACVGCAYLYS